ncbi:hypothetical protein E2C01_015356 [Portunus trituberculatus]|uniref:Uncharacterized protein n=1 Tax=Portunus trituberculatus TaxID=210409 RepID=A0A5B7DMS8_PORTR|nr:hypothetical protein [Portunus trituberculatus]
MTTRLGLDDMFSTHTVTTDRMKVNTTRKQSRALYQARKKCFGNKHSPKTKDPQDDLNHEVSGEGKGAILERIIRGGSVEQIHNEQHHVHQDEQGSQQPHDEVLHKPASPPLHIAESGRSTCEWIFFFYARGTQPRVTKH